MAGLSPESRWHLANRSERRADVYLTDPDEIEAWFASTGKG